jgi:hypothetical protein
VYWTSGAGAMTAEHWQDNENDLYAATPYTPASTAEPLVLHLDKDLDPVDAAGSTASTGAGLILADGNGDDETAIRFMTTLPLVFQPPGTMQHLSAGSGNGSFPHAGSGLFLNTAQAAFPGSAGGRTPGGTGASGAPETSKGSASDVDGMILGAAPEASVTGVTTGPMQPPGQSAGTGSSVPGGKGVTGSGSLPADAPFIPKVNPADQLSGPVLTNPDGLGNTGLLPPGLDFKPGQSDISADARQTKDEPGPDRDEITRPGSGQDASRNLLQITSAAPINEPAAGIAICLGLLGLLRSAALRRASRVNDKA